MGFICPVLTKAYLIVVGVSVPIWHDNCVQLH